MIDKNIRFTSPYCDNGFTLAETLITLVIVGVIAALTVPTLITKYQKEQTVTRLKKAYSALSQTTQRAIADYGPMATWEIGANLDPEDAKIFMNKYIVPYMNVMKEPTTLAEGNWDGNVYFLNGTLQSPSSSDGVDHQARFFLTDGTSISGYIQHFNDGGNVSRLTVNIDVNGDKKPNKMGRDIFMFHYYLLAEPTKYADCFGRFMPDGMHVTRNEALTHATWRCNKKDYGAFCASVIMRDGWRIADDYPW